MSRYQLLLALCFTGIMTAQPLVQINPVSADIAATGIKLASINDPEYTATMAAILAEDTSTMAPLLPYGVLFINGSNKLRAVGVGWQWRNAAGRPRRFILILTAMSQPEDPLEIAPGAVRLYTPVGIANEYLALPSINRKGFLQNTQTASGARVSPLIPGTDLSSAIQERLAIMDLVGATDLHAFIEGVVLHDFSYLGSGFSLPSLQRDEPKVHR